MKFKSILTALALVFIASTVFAAGTVLQSRIIIVGKSTAVIVFTCTGDASDGTVPDEDINAQNLKYLRDNEYYLIDVIAFPTPSGTAPDAADVTVKIKSYPVSIHPYATVIEPAVPRDILESAGVNLIHATDEQNIGPSMPNYERVVGGLTLGVANQATVSADFTIILKFEK